MAERFHLRSDDREWTASVDGVRVSVTAEGQRTTTEVHAEPDGRVRVTTRDGVFEAITARDGDTVWIEIDGHLSVFSVRDAAQAGRGGARDADALSPPMPATVVRIAVSVGAAVRKGDVLIALEAMKMELPIRAPRDGVVRAVHCREGELVPAGTPLVELEEPTRP